MIIEQFMAYKVKLYILDLLKLKKESLERMDKLPYSIYIGYQKIITTVRTWYFWPRMEIGNYKLNCKINWVPTS